jgi:hypothetical protein
MSDTPNRIQRKRAKGWRMPENTVSVTRPGPLGNPFLVRECREAFGYSDDTCRKQCVRAFRGWLSQDWREWWDSKESEERRAVVLARLPELRGKDLACWCALDQPCHADVLLELANAEPQG